MRRGVIFDLDGTLVDCMPDFCQMITAFLKKIGADIHKPVEPEQVKSFISNGAKNALKRILESYGVNVSKQDEYYITKIYMDSYNVAPLDKSSLFKNVKETLDILKQEGCKMAVCSNKPSKPAMLILKKLGIKDFFHTILTAEMTPFLKPDVRLMQLIMEQLELGKDELVMVGDSEVDVMAARAIDIPAVIVSYGFSSKPVETLGADRVIDDFAELPSVLRSV